MHTTLELPSPPELGFLPKFADWREEQLGGIQRMIENPKRFTGLIMPTGSGKSLTYVAGAMLMGGVKRTLFLTSTRGLEDQLSRDFASVGVLDIRGQRNYPCLAVQEGGELEHLSRGSHLTWHGCDDGPCHAGAGCSKFPDRANPHIRPSCAYYGAVWDARHKDTTLVLTNYAYHMASRVYGQGLGKFDALVLDEAHEAAKELEGFLTFTVTADDAHHVQSQLPESDEAIDWRQWAQAHEKTLEEAINAMGPPHDAGEVRERRKLTNTLQKLTTLANITPDDWVLERDERTKRMVFSPIRVARYAEEALFQNIPHVVLTSATLTAKTFNLLGVKPEDALIWECDSQFPVSRRPVIHVSTMPPVHVDARRMNTDLAHVPWRMRIDNLIRPRQKRGWKGIIHTVSYRRMKYLLSQSEFKRSMIAHDGEHTRHAVEKFKQSPPGTILVSPSVTTGWDFPDADCRYQIIGKVPFPDTRGAIMTVRREADPDFIPYIAVQMLVQAAGRGMRSADDWCETLIVDDNIEWFIKKYRHMFPRWFMQAYSVTRAIPAPLDVDDSE